MENLDQNELKVIFEKLDSLKMKKIETFKKYFYSNSLDDLNQRNEAKYNFSTYFDSLSSEIKSAYTEYLNKV